MRRPQVTLKCYLCQLSRGDFSFLWFGFAFRVSVSHGAEGPKPLRAGSYSGTLTLANLAPEKVPGSKWSHDFHWLWVSAQKDFFFFKQDLFVYFSSLVTPCSIWDLISLTRHRTHIPCIRRWSLNHWTAREVPQKRFLSWLTFMSEPRATEAGQVWSQMNEIHQQVLQRSRGIPTCRQSRLEPELLPTGAQLLICWCYGLRSPTSAFLVLLYFPHPGSMVLSLLRKLGSHVGLNQKWPWPS